MSYTLRAESVRLANQNMIQGKKSDTDRLPASVKASLNDRRYTSREINSGYARAIHAHNLKK